MKLRAQNKVLANGIGMRKRFSCWPNFSAKSAGAILTVVLVSLLLSGCGGGGGGGGGGSDSPTVNRPLPNPPTPTNPNPNPPPPPPPNCIQTSEGCLTPTKYKQRINAIRNTHKIHKGFTQQWGLNRVKADYAWAHVQLMRGTNTVPGAGMTLGAIDTGIDTGHPMFSGKTVTEQFLTGARDEDGTFMSHGTAVASVMVGSPNTTYLNSFRAGRGVAWGADITMFAVRTGGGKLNGKLAAEYRPVTLDQLQYNDHRQLWPKYINTAVNWSSGGRSLDFVNVSLVYHGLIDFYSASDLTSRFGNTINALKQTGSTNKTVFVWAAGNNNTKTCNKLDLPLAHRHRCQSNGRLNAVSPSVLGGLPVRISALRSHVIAVVAVNGSGISWFSNRCGIAANWCIAAPGQNIRVAYYGPWQGNKGARGTAWSSGTSFAAPHVTAGLGLMKHFFRSQLSNTALVSRLYRTANKSGKWSNRSIYGQGLMDLHAALRPAGTAYVATGNQVDDGGMALDDTALNPGPAFGDSLKRSFAGQEIVAFDQLGAPFWYSLDGLAPSRAAPTVQSRLKRFMRPASHDRASGRFRPILGALTQEHSPLNPGQLGLMETPDLVDDGGHLSLLGRAIAVSGPVGSRSGFSLFSTGVGGERTGVSGLEFATRPVGSIPIAFRGGVVSERRSLLGSTAAGAFGRASGSSVFAGLEGGWQVGAWRLSAGAEIGAVAADVRRGMLSIRSPLTTSAFALRTGRELDGRDTVTFALSQPVRVESGRADYTVPVGRTIDGKVLRVSGSVDLEPSGRQLDLSAQWTRALQSGGDFRLNLGWSHHPGHRAAAEPELSALAGWRLNF